MSKNKFQRSDIPYRDRLLMAKFNTIAQHRDHAALTAMKIAMVALNETEGLGYMRLARFAHQQQKFTEDYYSDPEYWEVKLNQRLEQMGFCVREDGRIFGAVDDAGNTVPVKQLIEQEAANGI